MSIVCLQRTEDAGWTRDSLGPCEADSPLLGDGQQAYT
jgi:hypothetical protein